MRCACYDSRPVVSILACLSSAGRGASLMGERPTAPVGFAAPRSGPSCLTYLPTHLLPTDLLPTYLLPTYLRTYVPTYLPTYLGAGEFLIEGSLGAGLVLAARAHGVHGAREHLHALVDEAAQPVEAARRLHLERLDVRDAG